MSLQRKSEQNPSKPPFRKKGDLGIPLVISLFAIAFFLGLLVFRNYVQSEKEVTQALAQLQSQAPLLSIGECAQHTMDWYAHCNAMQQICDDTVPRMMKICLVLGDKVSQCTAFGKEILGYNFGATQCQPYFKDRQKKKACADTWQTIADFCKTVQNRTSLPPVPKK